MSGSLEQSSHNDNPFDISGALESAHNLYDQVANTIGKGVQSVEAGASALASNVKLPDLQITDSSHPAEVAAVKSAPPAEAAHPSLLNEVGNVVSTAASGAVKFTEQHPLQVVEDIGIGVAAGAVSSAAIGALGLGAVVASPWVIGGAAVAGAGFAGYELYTHWGAITHDTSIVGDPGAHTPQEVAQATQSVQDFGANALQTTLKVGSAIAATPVGYAIGAAVNDAGVAAITSLVAPEYAAGSTVGASEISSAGATGAVSDVGASATTVRTAANEVTSAAASAGTTSDASASAAPLVDAKAALATTGATSKVAMSTPDAPTNPQDAADLKEIRAALANPIEPPFTLDKTTMTVANQAGWTANVNALGNDEFGRGTLSFANGWATNMEKALAAGQPMSKELIESAAKTADIHGVSGNMYDGAEGILINTWKYGPEFKSVVWPTGVSPWQAIAESNEPKLDPRLAALQG